MKILIFFEDDLNNVLIDRTIHLVKIPHNLKNEYELPINFHLEDLIRDAAEAEMNVKIKNKGLIY